MPVHQPQSLTNLEAGEFYLEGERKIAMLADDLTARGVPARERALELIQTRDSLRTKARALMADRGRAAFLDATAPNLTLRQLVSSAYHEKGLAGDALWNYRAESASRSRASINKLFGLEP